MGREGPKYVFGQPAYDDRGMVNRGVEPWKVGSGGRGFIPRPTGLTIHTSVLLFLTQGQELGGLPRAQLARQSGIPRHSHDRVLKSALSSLLRLTRDRGRWRSTCTGCPLHLPMTSEVNGYRSQPTGRGCAAPVRVKGQDPAPPVT